MLTVPAAVAAGVVEAAGATVQGLLGFGINLVAAPLLVLIDPHFAPAPIVLASMLGSVMVGLRERGDVDHRALKWALAGRVPGTAAGTGILAVVTGAALRPVVGVIVLAGVILVAAGRAVRRTPATLLGVGLASGVMSTLAGLGGAPFGLVCRDLPGPRLRSTLALFVLAGALLSAAALGAAGDIDWSSLVLTAILLPGVIAGFGLSNLLVPFVDRRGGARWAVLVVAAGGALAAIAAGPW